MIPGVVENVAVSVEIDEDVNDEEPSEGADADGDVKEVRGHLI